MTPDSAIRYDDLVERAGSLGGSHLWLLDHFPSGATVLDCGCAGGFLARGLMESRQWTVDGIEIDPLAAARAASTYRRIFIGSLDDADFLRSLTGQYDRVVFGDVLEHLREPEETLRATASLLAPEGRVLISIPNIANWRMRWHLLTGNFKYQDSGLLDRTHVRFYTFYSAGELVRRAGYRIVDRDFTVGPPPLGRTQFHASVLKRFLPAVRRVLSFRPNLFAFQTLMELERLE